jgi:hypothetical protein
MNNYPYIPFVPDRNAVMRRMGSLKASFQAELEQYINEYIMRAQSEFTVRGRAETFDIMHAGGQTTQIAGHIVESQMLAKLLKPCSQAYVMCAAMPERDVAKINAAIGQGKGLLALVLDAYASEYVDGALDVIMERKNEALRRTGQTLTSKRFSAGYGDLDIKYQGVFYDLLNMRDMGVNITDRYLLIPEKSVIAIAGVE